MAGVFFIQSFLSTHFAPSPMANQPTKNKPMFYPWHHFVLLPAAFVLALYSIRRYVSVSGDDTEDSRLWFTVMLLAVVGLGVLVMLRQHYALRLQDRLIRLEVRQRYFELTGQSLRPLEMQLELSQILALRFAGDAELADLTQAAIREKLSSKDIQARIQDFQFDHLRV
ncbi:DUF6526 family protein [Hymenobacter duratus]|nr:DUF6526 family protein [Hymenobacter duratus]